MYGIALRSQQEKERTAYVLDLTTNDGNGKNLTHTRWKLTTGLGRTLVVTSGRILYRISLTAGKSRLKSLPAHQPLQQRPRDLFRRKLIALSSERR
jgi:hypothetical protein